MITNHHINNVRVMPIDIRRKIIESLYHIDVKITIIEGRAK